MSNTYANSSRTTSGLLWALQVLLAALFLFAGGFKLVTPIAVMTQQVAMPGLFLRFIGLAEVAGALGLILPGLLRIRPILTPLAAAGLVIIMIGAVGATMATAGAGQAVMPGVVGILAAGVAVGRWRGRTPVATRRPRLQEQAA
jgi:DoxX-like protein